MTDSGSYPRTRPRIPNWLKVTLALLVVGASFYFLLSRLVRDWHQIPFHELRFRPLPLFASYALVVLHFVLYGYGWKSILAGLGDRLKLSKSVTYWSVAQLGKYIPGKVWFALGRVELAARDGIPRAKSLVSVLIEMVFALLSAILLFGVAVPFVPRAKVPGFVYYLFALVPACLVLAYPPVLNRVMGFVLRRLRQPTFELRMSYSRLLWTLMVYTLDWLVQAAGCFIMVNSLYHLSLSSLPVVVGGYSVAWILGFLSLVTPAGLGIREGIFTFVLRIVLVEPIAIVAALLTRVWITLGELAAALALAPFLGRKLSNGKEETPRI